MLKSIAIPALVTLLTLSCQANTNIQNTAASADELSDKEVLDLLFVLVYNNDNDDEVDALSLLDRNWEEGMIAPLVEIMRFSQDRTQLNNINNLLNRKTEKSHASFFEWTQWMWEIKPEIEAYYFDFKAEVYKNIDPKFFNYFEGRVDQANIRLEEVVWGGVLQDGIPPLRHPNLITPAQADYLADSDVVFGAYINGVAKAYPKRILAWHEMFIDDFGDEVICGVYCTLCGTVIAYNTEHDGVKHDLGTSGFLYKSNKLMYDQATQSLWNTIEGQPVLGPLYDSGIELEVRPIVTTTWGEWKKIHPQTTVLSLETGHSRDYGEGVAYQNYFATDELMFPVPITSDELKNKDEVLIIRSEGHREDPQAISIRYLKKKKWHQGQVNKVPYLVLSDISGAARVFERDNIEFKSYKKNKLTDVDGNVWQVSHDKLLGPGNKTLYRLPSHNTFWFAWFNTYPKTRLIK